MSVNTRKRGLKKPDWLRWSDVKKPVYHGTYASADFKQFDPTKSDLGIHLGSTVEQASYRFWLETDKEPMQHARIYPLWFHVVRLLRLKDVGSFHSDAIADQLVRKKIISRALAKELDEAIENNWRARDKYDAIVREKIKEAGYDGIVYKNTVEGGGDSYIAFSPSQLKAVYGNRGAFDVEDPIMTNPAQVIPTTPAAMRWASEQLKEERAIKLQALKHLQSMMFWRHGRSITLEEAEDLFNKHAAKAEEDLVRQRRAQFKVVSNPSKIITIPISQLYTPPWKAYEVAVDVAEGRLSGTDAPIIVSRMGRGKYLLMDGHHRALEARLRGEKKIAAEVNPHMPTAYHWESSTKRFIEVTK